MNNPSGCTVHARNLRVDFAAQELVAVPPPLLGFADLDHDLVDRLLQTLAESFQVRPYVGGAES